MEAIEEEEEEEKAELTCWTRVRVSNLLGTDLTYSFSILAPISVICLVVSVKRQHETFELFEVRT